MANGRPARKGADPSKVASAAQRATDFVNDLCMPEKMTPAEAVDFYEQVVANCESSIEALKEENEELQD